MTERDTARPAGSRIRPGRIVLAILLIYVLLLGGSEVGTFSAAFRALNALIGGILVAWWIVLLRRGADRVDLLAMGSLLAFLAACLFSSYPRQSFDAAVSALAWAAAFGVARRYLGTHRERRMLFRLLSLGGLLLSLYFAVAWGSIWVEWLRLSGTAPPLDLHLPAHIYRHHYVVAMLLATLMPASAALLRDRWWRYPAALTMSLSVMLILMSGSRGVWLAIGLAAVVVTWRLKPSRRLVVTGLAPVVGVVAVAALFGLIEPLVSRTLTSSTVTFRFDIWSSTLGMWAEGPAFGIGPGAFGIGMTSQPVQEVYQFVARHADNALIQLAAEAGAVGLIGAILGLLAVWTGRKPDRRGWLATIGLTTVAGSSLTNNPLDTANLVAVSIAWCAFLAPFSFVESPRDKPANAWSLARGSTFAAAVTLAAAVAVTTAASLSHAGGLTAMRRGDPGAALDELERATALDPAMALYRRELGVLLIADGQLRRGISALERAVGLNPADTAALRALSLAHAEAGDGATARAVAERATGLRPLYPENHLVLALVAERAEFDAAIRDALTVSPWLPASPGWLAGLPKGADLDRLVREAAERATDQPAPRRALSIVWLRAIAGLAQPQLEQVGGEVALEALALTLTCRTEEAMALQRQLGITWVGSAAGTASRILLDRERDAPDLPATIALATLQQHDLAATSRPVAPYAAAVDPQEDARLYRRLSMGISTPGAAIPRDADGMSGWLSGSYRGACARGDG